MAKAPRRGAVVLMTVVLGLALVAPALPAAATAVGAPAVASPPIVEHYTCWWVDLSPRRFALDLTVTGSVPTTLVVPQNLDLSGLTVSIPAWVTGGGVGASITDVSYVVRVTTGGPGAEITDVGGPVTPAGFTTAPASASLDVFVPSTSSPTAIPVGIGDVGFTVHARKDGVLIDRRIRCDIGDSDVTPLGVASVRDPVLVGVAMVRADLAQAATGLAHPSADLVSAASDLLSDEVGGAGGLLRLGGNEPAMRKIMASVALVQQAIDLGSTGLVDDRHRLALIGEALAARAIAFHLDLHSCDDPDATCEPFIVAQVGFQRATIRYAQAAADQGLDVLALAAYHDVVSHDF